MTDALAFQRLGAGEPLIILHGLFGSGTNWRGVARRVAHCRDVFLPDARNHGASPHLPSMTYPEQAGDVLAFMDRHGIRRADIVGHSMGGKTAMQLALEHPQRVARLMVVDIAPESSVSDHAPLVKLMRALPLERYARRGEVDGALEAFLPEASLRAFIVQNVVSDGGALRWRLNLEVIERSLPALTGFPEPAGSTYPGETLFVRGERSTYVQEHHHARIRTLFPDARIETLADAGHWPHVENPDAFMELLAGFLGSSAG